jgi:hypothetical protein
MELPVDVRYKMTEAEFVGAVRRAWTKHPLSWVLAAFAASSAVIAFLCASSDRPGPGAVLWGVATAGSAFYLFYLILMSPGNAYRRMTPAVREGQLHFRFTSTGVELKSDSFQARWDWNLFGHFSEEKEFFMIYPRSGGNSILLPKRAFESTESMDALRALLKDKLRAW